MDTLINVHAPAYKKNGTNFAFFLGLHFPHQSWCVPAQNAAYTFIRALFSLFLLFFLSRSPISYHLRFVPGSIANMYPPAMELDAAKHQYSPIGAPDVAFTGTCCFDIPAASICHLSCTPLGSDAPTSPPPSLSFSFSLSLSLSLSLSPFFTISGT